MAIFNIQRAITLKVGKQELRLMCSACHLMVLTFVSSFMKICEVVLKLWSGHKNCAFCMSSHGVNICVKFHENM